MKSGTDYLKEYLIKVGWDFDEKKLKLADDTTGNFLTRLSKQIRSTQGLWSLASKIAVAGITEITKATINLLDSTAQAGEEVDKMAKRYWTTSENWRAFSSALDTLGISYEDLFFTTDEELNKFRELYSYSKSLEVPKGIEDTLVNIREIRQEFNKLKVLQQYFFRALTYYIGEDTKDEIRYWRDTIRDIVRTTTEKMPAAARIIGRGLSLILRFVSTIGKGVKFIWDLVSPIIQWIKDLPGQVKLIGSIMGLVLLGPLGQIIAALTMIMLLIEDYMYWKAGKHSALDWSGVDSGIENLKNTFESAKESAATIKEKAKELFDLLGIDPEFNALDILQNSLEGIEWLIEQITKGIENIVSFGEMLTGEKSFSEFSKQFTKNIFENKEGGFIDKLVDWGFNKLGIERKDQNIPLITDTQALLDAGIIKQGAQSVKNTANSISIDSHDTYNVNSVEEADSLIGVATRRIVKSLNAELSPVVR